MPKFKNQFAKDERRILPMLQEPNEHSPQEAREPGMKAKLSHPTQMNALSEDALLFPPRNHRCFAADSHAKRVRPLKDSSSRKYCATNKKFFSSIYASVPHE